MNVLQLRYEIALKIQNTQMLAKLAEPLDLLDVQLMKRNFFQCRQYAIVVFGPLHIVNTVKPGREPQKRSAVSKRPCGSTPLLSWSCQAVTVDPHPKSRRSLGDYVFIHLSVHVSFAQPLSAFSLSELCCTPVFSGVRGIRCT